MQKIKRVNRRALCKGILSLNNGKLLDLQDRLGVLTAAFDIPAGFTCPAASICLTLSNRETGKMSHGVDSLFTCYASKAETMYPTTRAMRWQNFELTKDTPRFIDTLSNIFSQIRFGIVRVHASGDMYNMKYYRAWREIAINTPQTSFFGYSKLANVVKDTIDNPIANFKFVYSIGGKMDAYAIKYNLPSCTVVTSDYKISKNIDGIPTQFFNPLMDEWNRVTCQEVYSDDYEAVINQESFGIMLH